MDAMATAIISGVSEEPNKIILSKPKVMAWPSIAQHLT
jgi:hypothetical protein